MSCILLLPAFAVACDFRDLEFWVSVSVAIGRPGVNGI